MSALRPKRPRVKLEREAYKILRRYVLERDGWKCQKCGSGSNLEVHHQRSRSLLGNDEEENLITMCRSCHKAEHQRRQGSTPIT